MFFKEEVVIVTNDGKISLKETWDQYLVKKINEKLKGFKIESGNDFTRLKEALTDFGNDKYSAIEMALVNHIKNFWRFFNPGAVQVPRPMSIVFRKDIGIKEFVVFSLNAKNFEGALNANRSISDYLAKKIKDQEEMKEENILMLIKEAIDREHELADFELRIGVVFNNYSNGKYNYTKGSLDNNKQFDFVSKLIEKYDVCYVENPFREDDLDSYKKLLDKYSKKCLVCINSKINEYTESVKKKAVNIVFAKFEDVPSFKAELDFFKDNKIHTVVEGVRDIMDIVVGLGIPLVKLTDDDKGNFAAKRLVEIADEIIAFKKKT